MPAVVAGQKPVFQVWKRSPTSYASIFSESEKSLPYVLEIATNSIVFNPGFVGASA